VQDGLPCSGAHACELVQSLRFCIRSRRRTRHRCPRSALWSSFREHRFLRNQGRCAVIPRGMGLQFRAEIFNLFNHPQFFMNGISATGEQDIGTPSSFGVLNGTVNNRAWFSWPSS